MEGRHFSWFLHCLIVFTFSLCSFNNAPKTLINPIVRVKRGRTQTISIPMIDTDGDVVRCRWGASSDECGGICTPKGNLQPYPCQLTYNATQLGYEAVALVIEDFDANNQPLSAVPIQFLIQIFNQTNCTLPEIIGELPNGACIGVASNTTITERIVARTLCTETPINISGILFVSPSGLTKGQIISDPSLNNTYFMDIQWTPRPDQYGIHQICMIPVDSEGQTGQQVCYTFQVDMYQPQFINGSMTPTGVVSQNQSLWSIETDQDILPPYGSNISIHFYRRMINGSDQEVLTLDAVSQANYETRRITFSSGDIIWKEVSLNIFPMKKR